MFYNNLPSVEDANFLIDTYKIQIPKVDDTDNVDTVIFTLLEKLFERISELEEKIENLS